MYVASDGVLNPCYAIKFEHKSADYQKYQIVLAHVRI